MSTLENVSDGILLLSTFYLGDALMGIDALRVQEVIKVNDITMVHHAPDFIMGIMNLRGRIVTVVDLAKRLDLCELKITDDSRIIIVDWDNENVGLLVDAISEVIPADETAMMPPPSNVSGVQGKFFQGVYKFGDHLIAILGVDRVLSIGEN